MPKLTAQYTGLDGIDLDQFPSEITFTKHGKEGEREWWEWWDKPTSRNRKGIVFQRPNQKQLWLIFFEQGERLRTLDLPVTEQDKARRVVAKTFGALTIEQAIQALADLGIKAKLGE